MAADNVTANAGSGGSIFRTLSDGTNEWPVSALAWPTTISPGSNVLQLVDGTHGLPVAVVGSVVVTGSGTFTVAGTATVTQGTAAALAGAWPVKVTDGTNTMPTGDASARTIHTTIDNASLAVSGTFWQATQPVSAASLPLPTGAATSAKQPALGTAGTASADVLTVQGIAAMTALKVDGSGVTQPVSGTFWQATQPISGTITANAGSGTFTVAGTVSTNADAPVAAGTAPSKSLLIAGVYNTAAPTLTNTQTVALQTDVNGLLKVNVAAGGGSGGTSSSFASTFPATGTAVGASDGTNMKALLVDGSGFLKVNVAAGSGGNGAASNTGSAVPAQAGYTGVNVGGNLVGASGYDLDTGAGTEYALGISLRQSASGGSIEIGSSTHPLRTDPTGTTTQPVSGTVTVTQGTAANLKVDASGATVPVSGTFWQATQPVSGTITANIGASGSLALDASVGKLNVAQGASLGTNTGPMVQGSVTTSAPTYTTGQVSPISLTTTGMVRVDASGTTVPVSGTFWQATQPVSAASLPLPAGAATAAKQPALGTAGSASADVITVQGVTSMTALKVDGSAVTQPVSGTVTANAGTGTMAVSGTLAVTESGTWTVQPGNTPNTAPWLVSQTPATSGGCSIYRLLSAASTNSNNVKGSAGQVYGWAITNTNASPRFVKFYNKATAPTVGTDTPVITLVIPGNASGAGMVAAEYTSGIAFGTGIGIGITGVVTDADTTAVAANEVVVNLFYK